MGGKCCGCVATNSAIGLVAMKKMYTPGKEAGSNASRAVAGLSLHRSNFRDPVSDLTHLVALASPMPSIVSSERSRSGNCVS